MTQPNPQTRMPKWLIYGLIAKGIIVVLVTAGVVAYATLR